jgi:molybdopterin molybdotransferase
MILTFEQARHLVEDHARQLRPRGRELLGLLDAIGSVLAEPIHADRDFPPFPRATRDGFAVCSADVVNIPATLDVVGEVRAGSDVETPTIEPGQAVSIMTGAPVPGGADTIVMVEFTSSIGNRVEVRKTVAAGENIVPAGAEGKRGAEMLAAGTRLDFAGLAVAAAVGRSRVVVHARPRVAVLCTGDEIVDVDVLPASNQIRNSNGYSLAAQISVAGGEPILLPIAPDEGKCLRELLLEGFDCDLLLIAGGVSMGKYDLVEQVLAEMKAEFFFTGAQIQPGKPVVFGAVPGKQEEDRKYFLGLPGNPVSTMVCFELFAKPVIEALAGIQPRKLVFVHARLKTAFKTKPGLKRFLPATLSGEFEHGEVELVGWQGSGDLSAVVRSNCYIVVPPDRERIEAGEFVPVLLR